MRHPNINELERFRMAFRKPVAQRLGVKVLALGETGVGKSFFALTFPKSAVLDSEAGIAFYEGTDIGKNIVMVSNTQDYNEQMNDMDEVAEIVEDGNGEIQSLIIDSETKFYQNLCDTVLTVEEKKARKNGRDVNDSNISVRGWGRIKNVAQRMQNNKIDLSSKGVNVISISQIEDKKKKVGDTFEVVGYKAVMAKNAEYDYDIVIKLYTEGEGDNIQYKGIVLKDRTRTFRKGEVVDNPSYDLWKKAIENDGTVMSRSYSSDSKKAQARLEEHIEETEESVIEAFKKLMSNDSAKEVAKTMIKEKGIKNPLAPKNELEFKMMGEIVEAMKKVA